MKRHLVSLSFDDGFRKSFSETARIHEGFGLKAGLNVVSNACEADYVRPDPSHNSEMGGWELWNELRGRGHEIMPHSHTHADHAGIPLEKAMREVDLALEAFSVHLKGFDPARAVYNFPYNRSTPEVEEYILGKFRACRTGGSGFNPWPGAASRRLTTTGLGPGNCEEHLDSLIVRLLAQERGWLVYNLHGLDEEGWGPVGSEYLKRLLERLSGIESVEVLPAGAALEKYA